MLLIYDNAADIAERGKDCTTCANNDIGFASSDTVPFIATFAIREGTVQHRNPVTQAPSENTHQLSRKGNLRHQHESCSTCGECLFDGREVDLSFARSRHAVQEDWLLCGRETSIPDD